RHYEIMALSNGELYSKPLTRREAPVTRSHAGIPMRGHAGTGRAFYDGRCMHPPPSVLSRAALSASSSNRRWSWGWPVCWQGVVPPTWVWVFRWGLSPWAWGWVQGGRLWGWAPAWGPWASG